MGEGEPFIPFIPFIGFSWWKCSSFERRITKDCQGFSEQVNCRFLLGGLMQELRWSQIRKPAPWLDNQKHKSCNLPKYSIKRVASGCASPTQWREGTWGLCLHLSMSLLVGFINSMSIFQGKGKVRANNVGRETSAYGSEMEARDLVNLCCSICFNKSFHWEHKRMSHFLDPVPEMECGALDFDRQSQSSSCFPRIVLTYLLLSIWLRFEVYWDSPK